MSNSNALSDARRRANELLGQKEAERISTREKERQAQDAKIARLRALRLAKEASDKAAGSRTSPSKRERAPAQTYARFSGRIEHEVVSTVRAAIMADWAQFSLIARSETYLAATNNGDKGFSDDRAHNKRELPRDSGLS